MFWIPQWRVGIISFLFRVQFRSRFFLYFFVYRIWRGVLQTAARDFSVCVSYYWEHGQQWGWESRLCQKKEGPVKEDLSYEKNLGVWWTGETRSSYWQKIEVQWQLPEWCLVTHHFRRETKLEPNIISNFNLYLSQLSMLCDKLVRQVKNF